MISAATFGSSVVPTGALAWMHGMPNYLQLIPSELSKYFTGYSGPLGNEHGIIAATLQFKLFTAGTSMIANAFEEDNLLLDRMAQNPEEIIAGFVAFVGIGYAIGYMPQIPVIPSSIPGSQFLTGYGTFINAITAEAHAAQAGVMPFTSLEYGFLGFKTMLLINNMLAGKKMWH
jgi:hypothetical protein